MDLMNVVIETERLRLLPTSENYANEIFSEFSEGITTYMVPKSAENISETLNFINISREKMTKGEELQVVILDKKTEEFLGHGGVTEINTQTPELGIWIKEEAHGNNYGREAVEGLKEWADKNLKFTYLMYPVDKKNIASRKIAESLGGVIEEEYEKVNLSGKTLSMVEYRIYPKKSN